MPIKPIPNVITHAEDITGGKVRQLLQKDLKGQKVCVRTGAREWGWLWAPQCLLWLEVPLHNKSDPCGVGRGALLFRRMWCCTTVPQT